MPIVSVIMSVYNTGKESILSQAVESIRNQTVSDWECIVCDDGSTDDTYSILDRLCRDDPRFKLIRNAVNEKAASARNRCLVLCSAEYVAVMDADDISALDRLALQLEFLRKHPNIAFVGSAAALFDDDGVWGKRRYPALPDKQDFLFVLPFVHGSLLFRSHALRSVGGYRVARETQRTEDYDLLMRMYAAGYTGANMPDVLYSVREDESLYRRRKYWYRFNEARVRYRGFRSLSLLPAGLPYVVKPLLVGLIPHRALSWLKDRHYGRRKGNA